MARHFLTIGDLIEGAKDKKEERKKINDLIDSALRLKKRSKAGISYHPLFGKVVALLFEKPSTRTRVSFEAGIAQLGGTSFYLSLEQLQIRRGEPIKDTARVLARYVDAVVIRTFGHETLDEFAKYSDVPIINGLSDLHHPCQILSDLFTIKERGFKVENSVIAYVGDGNNVCNSWLEAAGILGFELRVATPENYKPDVMTFKIAASKNSKIRWTADVKKAVKGARIVYTDVWASMGQDAELLKRKKIFKPYQVNDELLKLASKKALVMHCLPAHRGDEITDEVIESDKSIVFDQAENRMHLQKALLVYLLEGVLP